MGGGNALLDGEGWLLPASGCGPHGDEGRTLRRP
jgi:hypothetical protein